MPGTRDAADRWILAALVGAALLGCSRHQPPPASGSPAPPFAQSSSDEFADKNDPCSLLDPKEVEAVLGAPLAVPPYRSGNSTADPVATGDNCIYETANFRYISVDVTFEGGAQAYSMTVGLLKNLFKGGGGNAQIANNVKRNFKLDDGTEMSGEWDEASLTPMQCCIFNAMRGDQLITIDFSASPATLRQAAGLVDAAYKRIDHRLIIDGGAGVDAAKALDKTRPQPADVCGLITRAEVEAILGPLKTDPQPGRSSQRGCTYVPAVDPGSIPLEVDLQIDWRGGYSEWRSDHHIASIGMGALAQVATDVRGAPVPGMPTGVKDAAAAAGQEHQAPGADPAETVGDEGTGIGAVKRDVLVKVVGRTKNEAQQLALVTAVLQKI